ncbi:MAG: PhoD-like phosphatase, partial [Cyanobacteria bacterium P01_G01_bin.49]
GTVLSSALPPGKRCEIAQNEGGLTAMLENKQKKAKSHLFSFSEYAIAYLLAWSPTLMPKRLPSGTTLFGNCKQAKQWQQELEDTNSFINDLAEVRRALANIPVYTICDDHDVSDDWYLNREWCDRVLGKPFGKRIIQNGLLAYALFQAWGNTPEHFEPGTPGEKLLQMASRWLMSEGKDTVAKAECDRYLGIPETDQTTGLPKLEKDEDVLILARDTQAIPWHYSISSDKHEVIVLDTRTWRGYPVGEDNKLEPPMLLCPKAFEQQLQVFLAQSQPDIEATIVVVPTNLVTLGIIDRIQQFELSRNRVFSSDVGDSWNFHQEAFAQLLLAFCQQRKRVIIFSGDIHYSCAVCLTHWFHDSSKTSVLVQLTSSAIKNSELATRLAHTKIKSLVPEKTERFFGWEQPLTLQKVTKSKDLDSQKPLPDWQYRIQWCQRQPSQSLPWRKVPRQSQQQPNWLSKLITLFVAWIWRNRWLQEGPEVIGRNNLSLVKFHWSTTKAVIQETYWHPPWNETRTVRSCYEVSLEPDSLPPLPNRK